MWSLAQRTHRLGYVGYTLLSLFVIGMSFALVEIVARKGHSTALISAVAAMIIAASLWIVIAASVRRLHDIGWSGWWIALALVPPAGLFQAYVLLSRPSQPAVNTYGPPPGMRWTSYARTTLVSAWG